MRAPHGNGGRSSSRRGVESLIFDLAECSYMDPLRVRASSPAFP